VSVAVVEGGLLTLRRLSLDRDLGREIEVIGGLSGNELLIVNPSTIFTRA
jgi:hypothetical protein